VPLFCCLVLDPASAASPESVRALASACSPRVTIADRAAVFDAAGLSRVIGAPREIAAEVQRLAGSRGLSVRVAVARSMTAAWLLAHARAGCTVADGNPAQSVAALPVGWLGTLGTGRSALGTRHSLGRTAGRSGNYRQAPGPSGMQPSAEPRVPSADPRVPDVLAIF
jgi:hypothetical protein